ncbi:MAG: hypothetical protein KDI92_04530 [Xanthomonadales bacterium]|nr:hypothetical protein [Xanthomonadales bacterium]
MQSTKVLTILIAFVVLAVITQRQTTIIKLPVTHKSDLFESKKTPKKYDQPDQAASWLASMRQSPKGTSPAQLNLQNIELIKQTKAQKTNQDLPALQFEELGPGIFGGRIRGFVIHPEREGHLLIGGVSGGVWKSTDDGLTWESKSDFLANIAIGSMLIDPDNPEKVYVGTGEGFFNFDAAQGYGIFVTENFGETWSRFGTTESSDFYYVNRLAKVPESNTFLAATRTGIFKTENDGSTWSEVSDVVTSGRGFTDLKLDPSNPNHLLAYHFGTEKVNLQINSPNDLSGDYEAILAAFSPDLNNLGLTGEVLLVADGTNPTRDGCEAIENDINGKIALIERGACNFTVKVKNAQDAGAIAVIVFNNTAEDPITMGGDDPDINIPSVMISQDLGEEIIDATQPVQVNIQFLLDRFVMRSTNGGDFWTKLDNHGLPDMEVERIEIAFGSDGKTYIAVSTEPEEIDEETTPGTIGLFRSIGSSNTNFVKTDSNTNFIERQGWYDLAIAVNPEDSNHVFVGAVDQYVTIDGGVNINKNSEWNTFILSFRIEEYIHADHHGYFFSPHNNNHIYVVSDGGVFKSEDGGESWFHLNNGLNISQSYGIAVSPDGLYVNSGTQDNGSQLFFGNQQAWIEWSGGDGGYSAWDQQQPQYIYSSRPSGSMRGSNNGGKTSVSMSLPDTEGARFIQPFVLDENNGNRMLVGTDNVFFSNNVRFLNNATWVDVTDTINGAGVSALAFNPHTSTVAYAGMSNSAATGANQIVKITGLGTTNTVTDIAPANTLGVAGAVVTDIKVDTFDTSGQTLYATFGSYQSNRILRSTDGGVSWNSISNNLPHIPLYQVLNDPTDDNVLFVGSELGLWVGKKSGNTYNWTQFDYGPAFTRVIDLVWNNNALFIGTHGRGTYKATKRPIDVALIKFIGTNSSCDVDNIMDLGESGKLMIAVENKSGKNFSQVTLQFNSPDLVNFTDAQQTFSLDGFSSKTLALGSSLSTQASCLAELEVPVTVTTSEGSYDTQFTIQTAANVITEKGTFSDGAENVNSKMQSVLALGNDGWIQVNDSVNTGNKSWFTTNEDIYSDKSLVTPWLTFAGGGNKLKFAMSYNTEGSSDQHWDGLVLEMRLNGTNNWFDIGHLSSIPYDGQLSTNNTAQAQFAWSGTRLAWRDVEVNLGTQYVGKKAQIRFRMISDTNTAIEGFWVDDISISNVINQNEVICDVCQSSNNRVPNKGLWYDPAHNGHGFIIEAVGGTDGRYYSMFYTYDNDGNPEWYNSVTSLSNGVLNQGFSADTLAKYTYDYNINPSEANPISPVQELTDGRLSIDFNSETVIDHPACQDGVARSEDYVALATWRINDVTESWCITPLIADEARPDPDFGTSWWGGPDENGWGYSLAQTGDVIIAYIFYYDAEGNARWAIGNTSGFEPNKNITVPMDDVFGYGRTATPVDRTFVSSGSIVLNLSNTLRDLDTDGSTTVDVTYQGSEGGRWLRENIKIMTLMQEH